MQKGTIRHCGPIEYREPSHQAGGDGNDHLVDQTRLNETADNLAAAFHHDAPDAPLAKQMQQIRQMNPVKTIALAANDFRTPVFDHTDLCMVIFVGTGQPATMIGSVKKTGLQGDAQITVKNNRLGILSLDQTNRQQGIIDQQRIDADDDGVAGRADAMGEDH
jgi:hypothetical protein